MDDSRDGRSREIQKDGGGGGRKTRRSQSNLPKSMTKNKKQVVFKEISANGKETNTNKKIS